MIARVGLDRSASFFASRRVLASFQFPTIEKGKNVDVKEPFVENFAYLFHLVL